MKRLSLIMLIRANTKSRNCTNRFVFFAKICHLDAENALKYSVNLPELPEGADGWFAFPKWQAWGNEDYYDLLIGIPYGMSHFRKRNFSYSSEEHLYQSQRTRRMFHQIYAKQEGDIIILPIQTGFFHSGRSVRRAREVFFDNEFGLDTLTTMLILKSHPERMEIGNDNNLSMCCAGDDFSMDGLRCFTFHASAISHCRSKNFFDALPLDSPRENYGAVTGFAL